MENKEEEKKEEDTEEERDWTKKDTIVLWWFIVILIGIIILVLSALFALMPHLLISGLDEWKEFVCEVRGKTYTNWNGVPYCFSKDELYKEKKPDSFEEGVELLTA